MFIALIDREVSEYSKLITRDGLTFQLAERIALKTLIDNKDIIIKPAGKGGAMVVMDRSFYRNEVLSQLSNREVYLPLSSNPTFSVRDKIAETLERA
ncbi:unnamed protein product [Ranitomeya imitator]|uniref:Uncharacterized protein n=1 Tax=Ranitomeya imitator TaxID=111125 RepID=A0ABN9L2Y6_9NEOB|nr:unnamed protein product [Ranitomeya imitator]